MSPIKIDVLDLTGGKKVSGSLVVFPITSFLAVSSIVAAVLALVVYGSQSLTVDLWICQALVICASSASFVFLALYLLAARRNEPLGHERPPSRPLHAGSFIALRVTVILWIAGSISTLVVALKMPSCPASSIACELQQASAAMSTCAFFASLALIFVLDKCDRPFETPAILHIRPSTLPVCDDDLLERSVSRASTYHAEKAAVLERISEEGSTVSEHSGSSSIIRKHLPADSPILHHGFAQSEPAPFLPMPQKLSVFSLQALSQGFKVDRRLSSATNLFEETGCTKECCTPALSERIPSEYTLSSKQSSVSSTANDARSLTSSKSASSSSSVGNDSRSLTSSKSGPTTWNSSTTTLNRSKSGWSTPSSSGSSTRRSPLSTVRNADHPDIAIHPEFQNFQNFQASQIAALPPPQQWADPQYYKTGAILPHRPSSRQSSATSLMISPVSMRKQGYQNAMRQHGVPRPPTPRNPPSATRRRPGDMQVAGNHAGYEDAIDAHTRKIEESIAARVKDIERRERRLREQAEASMRMVPPSPRTSPRMSPGLSPKLSPRMPARSSPRPSSPRVTKTHAMRTPDLRYGDHRMRTPPRPMYHPFPPQNRSPRPRQQPRPISPQHRTSPQRSPRQWPLSNDIVVEPLRIVKRKASGDSQQSANQQLPLSPLPQQSPYPILGASKPSPPLQSLLDEPRPGSVTPRTAAAEPSHQYNWPIADPARVRVKARETDFDGQREMAREIAKVGMEQSGSFLGVSSEPIPEKSPVLPDLKLNGGKLFDGDMI